MKFLFSLIGWVAAVLLACTFAISCKKDNPTPVAAPDTYKVSVMDFSATRGSFHIGGKLYMPQGLEGKKPVAILQKWFPTVL